MARLPRFLISHQPTTYHVISRTALDGFPLGEPEKSLLLKTIQNLSIIYCCEVLGFCIMGNHHLLVTMLPEDQISDEQVQKRYAKKNGDEFTLMTGQIPFYRQKWTSLSEYVKEIKQNFTRLYNKKRGRRGTFWAERFKSLIVEKGETLVNLLAYIDLNHIRAGIVKRPEDYKWCSLGYHVQTNNKDELLCVDFGMKEWNEFDPKEIVHKYRQFVYETGAAEESEELGKKGIDPKIVKKERKKKYKIRRVDRFRYRCRYFSDAGIIGSKAFVGEAPVKWAEILRGKSLIRSSTC